MSNTQDNIDQINKLINQINFYYSSIVIPIGILLNIVNIIIFSSNKQKNSSNQNILYIGLSIYDILALLNSILFAQLLPAIGITLTNYSNAACVYLSWYRKIVVQAPSWAQMLITFERYTSVVSFNNSNIFKNKLNVVLMLISILILLTTVNLGQAWFYTSVNIKTLTVKLNSSNQTNKVINESIVSLTCTNSKAVSLATDIINLLFRFLIPIIFMLVMNILLSKNLYESKKRTSGKNRSFKRERRYTIIVIGFNVLFLTLNMPWAVWYVLSHLRSSGVAFQSASIVFSIFYLNNLSSFFLNLCFNKVYRGQL